MPLSRRSKVFTVIIIVALIIIAGMVLWFTMNPKPSSILTPAAVGNLLLQQAKVAVPSVVTSTAILETQLPSFMRTLVLPQATDTIVQAIMYTGTKLGYRVTYSDPEALHTAYAAFTGGIGKGGWKPIQGARADLFGYFEFSGNGLDARAEFTAVKAGSTGIVVSVVGQ